MMGCVLDDALASDPKVLRSGLGHFATGVTIVTTTTSSGAVGITVNSFASVSLDPPLVLWSIDRQGSRYDTFRSAEHYAIHILGAEQADLAYRIVKNASDFSDVNLEENTQGVPIIPDCVAVFECRQADVYRGGDHDIILGQVEALRTKEGGALGFFKGKMTTISE